MTEQLPALIILFPLIGALATAASGWLRPGFCFPISVVSLAGTLAGSLGVLAEVLNAGPMDYHLGGWPPPIGIVYRLDNLSALMAVVVSAAAFINVFSCRLEAKKSFGQKGYAFFSLYLLCVTGLLGIVVTGDAFNLYVLVEITSLTAYALIGMGRGRAPLASLNYVFLGTIGASFYLLGIGYLYILTGTLNMADLARLLPPLYVSPSLLAAFAMALVGLWLKMALFPMQAWLPVAYSRAPSGAAGLMAPLVTKVMIYVMIRLMLFVFTPEYVFNSLAVRELAVWAGTAAIVAGAFLALTQRELKMLLGCLVITEVGYMVGGAWLGNRLGMAGAVLHVVNDAFMTLCVFLAAGAITWKVGYGAFGNLEGLFKKMPWSMAAFTAGGMAMIGVPPTCGFFSKWYLIQGGLEAGAYQFVAALIFASLVSAVVFFRVFEIAYLGASPPGDHGHGRSCHGQAYAEAPVEMAAPACVAAGGLILLGLATGWLMDRVILPSLPAGLN